MSTLNRQLRGPKPLAQRRGVIVVLTGFLLCVIFAFVSLSVDSGRVVLTETEMQNAVDAAALAASQEITAAIYAAGQGEGPANLDSNSIAVASARAMAAQVAQANGVYIDPGSDVFFGKRGYNANSDTWPIQWGVGPFNVVKVVARKTNTNRSAPDAELPLAFGWAVGKESVPIQTTATAFVEARDLVMVLDFSGSMNDDSSLDGSLSAAQKDAALDNIWSALRGSNVKWPGTNEEKFPAAFGNINSAAGTYVASTTTSTVLSTLKLNQRNGDGTPKFPFPQAGRNSNGTPKSRPNAATSDSLWNGYINYVKGLSGTYKQKYGYRTLMSYLQEDRERWTDSEDLWRAPCYPFTAVKDGASLFLNFLGDLDFGDEVGLVSYADYAVREDSHYDGEVSINIASDPITDDYETLDNIQRRHQAAHYASYTNTGDGIKKGRELLLGVDGDPNDDGHARYGARPTMIVMTDGLANRKPSGWSLPGNFNWAKWTDYDGNGTANYSTTDTNKQYAFWEATECVRRGVTLHSIGVGNDADANLLRAIAFAGNGIFISVPGGTSIANMQEEMLEAFSQIAAKVPPAQLVYELPSN